MIMTAYVSRNNGMGTPDKYLLTNSTSGEIDGQVEGGPFGWRIVVEITETQSVETSCPNTNQRTTV